MLDGRTAVTHILSGRGIDAELERIEKLRIAMEELPDERNVARYTRAEEAFRINGGYAANSEARAIAAGLGLDAVRGSTPPSACCRAASGAASSSPASSSPAATSSASTSRRTTWTSTPRSG